MVKKYIILAYSNDDKCGIPRQLIEINGEKLIERTIRLLKENGVKDIIVTAKDKRFDNLGVEKYVPINNTYDYKTEKGYFLDMFPVELMNEPVCFIWGDVYFSEKAIKTIVETETNSTLFFCSYENKCINYIKKWDEPFAYKVVDIELFKKHIKIVKKLYDEKVTWRHPIVWELYRSINGLDVNTHNLTENYKVINDITCDIDDMEDVIKLKGKVEGKMKLSIIIPYYKTYELTTKLLDALIPQLTKETEVFLIDDGTNETRLDVYKNKITIIHLEENVGGAEATNIGLERASGEYIALIDSDDMIMPYYIKTLLRAIKDHKEDVIIFNWVDMHSKKVVERPTNYAPWKAIYRYTIMPRFRTGWIYSYDVPFQEDLANIEHTTCYINDVLYIYNSNREGSLTQEKERLRSENMFKCVVTEEFTLKEFDKLQNIKRARINTYGRLYKGDTFECDEEMVDYLTGKNDLNKVVVKVIEVPNIKEAKIVEETKPKKGRKKESK